MTVGLWVGSVTTLAGAFLGGVISYVLSRQQIREARRQHQEERRLQSKQNSRDRRFTCYSDFTTKARAYRNAVRSFSQGKSDQVDVVNMDKLAADADATSSLVFLVVESSVTYDACRSILKAIGSFQSFIRQGADANPSYIADLEDRLAASLREFQAASREELGVTGVGRALIVGRVSEVETESLASIFRARDLLAQGARALPGTAAP